MNTSVPEERLLQRIIEEKRPIQAREPAKFQTKQNPARSRGFLGLLVVLLALTGVMATLLYQNVFDPHGVSKAPEPPVSSPSAMATPTASAPVVPPPQTLMQDSKELKQIPPPAFLILRGVLDEDQEDKSALVENTQSSQSQTLREGDFLLNHKVSSIEKRRVVFTNEEETFILSL